MKFAFTAHDKAIVAAVIAPLIVWLTAYLNGGDFDEKNLISAVVAGIFAGVSVYLKSNKPAEGVGR